MGRSDFFTPRSTGREPSRSFRSSVAGNGEAVVVYQITKTDLVQFPAPLYSVFLRGHLKTFNGLCLWALVGSQNDVIETIQRVKVPPFSSFILSFPSLQLSVLLFAVFS